jgi:hypothetical protein
MKTSSVLQQGQQFGHLRVLDPGQWIAYGTRSARRRAALCHCDCGTEKLVSHSHLTTGRVTSCGCRANNIARIKIETGTRIGTLTVTGETRDHRDNRRVVLKCDCGREITRLLYPVADGRIREHCGGPAHRPEKPPASPRPPRVYKVSVEPGERYGTRTVVEAAIRDDHDRRAARTVCDCGREQVVAIAQLVRSQSCGCANPGWRNHGLCHHELFDVWKAMMARCYKPGSKDYRNYGARGITVWEPWHDVRRFIEDIEASIGPRPPGRYASGWAQWTLDRRDNSSGYFPGNVVWATKSEQARNIRPRSEWTPVPAKPGKKRTGAATRAEYVAAGPQVTV